MSTIFLRQKSIHLATALLLICALASGATTAEALTNQTKYPIAVTVDSIKTTISKEPKRIISLSPSATEILFGIGAGKQVLAVDANSNFPASAPISKLDGFTPNVEAIAAYKPDLVILQSSAGKANKVAAQLGALKIAVLMEVTPKNLKDVFAEMSLDGRLTNHTASTLKLEKSMQSRISSAMKNANSTKSYTFFHELDNTGYSATSSTFIGQVYKSFGLTNIADAAATADTSGYPQLSPEATIGANPDLVFLADAQYGESPSTFGTRPGFSVLTAVKNNHVFALPSDISSRWGPRIVNFYQLISTAVKSLG